MYESQAAELILVMDDEPTVAKAIEALLTLRGYRVLIAESCEEALSLVLEHSPNLVLADINMPCKSGIDFLNELRSAGVFNHVPVVFVSAMARIKDIQAGLRAGAKDYITKPFNPEILLAAVQRNRRAA